MIKVSFFDRRVGGIFFKWVGAISIVLSFVFPFIDIPKECLPAPNLALYYKIALFVAAILILYILIWLRSNFLNKVDVSIEAVSYTHLTLPTSDLV